MSESNLDIIKKDTEVPFSILRFKLFQRLPERVCPFVIDENIFKLNNINERAVININGERMEFSTLKSVDDFINICLGYCKFEGLNTAGRTFKLSINNEHVLPGRTYSESRWQTIGYQKESNKDRKNADFIFVCSNAFPAEFNKQCIDLDKYDENKSFLEESNNLLTNAFISEGLPNYIYLMSAYQFYRFSANRTLIPYNKTTLTLRATLLSE